MCLCPSPGCRDRPRSLGTGHRLLSPAAPQELRGGQTWSLLPPPCGGKSFQMSPAPPLPLHPCPAPGVRKTSPDQPRTFRPCHLGPPGRRSGPAASRSYGQTSAQGHRQPPTWDWAGASPHVGSLRSGQCWCPALRAPEVCCALTRGGGGRAQPCARPAGASPLLPRSPLAFAARVPAPRPPDPAAPADTRGHQAAALRPPQGWGCESRGGGRRGCFHATTALREKRAKGARSA